MSATLAIGSSSYIYRHPVDGAITLRCTSWLSPGWSYSSLVRKAPWVPCRPTLMSDSSRSGHAYSTMGPSAVLISSSLPEMVGSLPLQATRAVHGSTFSFEGPASIPLVDRVPPPPNPRGARRSGGHNAGCPSHQVVYQQNRALVAEVMRDYGSSEADAWAYALCGTGVPIPSWVAQPLPPAP